MIALTFLILELGFGQTVSRPSSLPMCVIVVLGMASILMAWVVKVLKTVADMVLGLLVMARE